MSTKKVQQNVNYFTRNERIIQATRALGIKRAEIIEKMSCSRTLLSRIMNKRAVVSEKFMVQFCNYFGISEEWVNSGRGEMHATVKVPEKFSGVKHEDMEVIEGGEIAGGGRKILEMFNSLSCENQYLAIQILTRLKESEKMVANTH